MYHRKPKGWIKYLDFIFIDIVFLQISFLCAYYSRFDLVNAYASSLYRQLAFVLIFSDFVAAAIFNTYSGVLRSGIYKTFVLRMKHTVIIFLLAIMYMFSVKAGEMYSRLVIVYTACFHLVFGYIGMIAYRRFRKNLKIGKKRALVVVTSTEYVDDVIESLKKDDTNDFVIRGAAVIDKDMQGEVCNGVEVVANGDSLVEYLCHEWVDEIYLKLTRASKEFEKLYTVFMEMGLTIHVDLGGISLYKDQNQELNKIGDALVLTAGIRLISITEAFVKRLMDIVGGLVGSILAFIVMAIFFVPIKIMSPGSLLYKSERIGLNGKHFKMYKIRTMRLNAEAMKSELMKDNRVKDGMMFKLDFDPRVIGNKVLADGTQKTGLGEFLRKTSLDEFPQFFNVLGGSMSLVGTRPPTPDEWEKYGAHHRARLATKPGITGLWQVSGRSDITDFEEIVRLDTEYITNWSFAGDLRILFKTFFVVLFRKGAL